MLQRGQPGQLAIADCHNDLLLGVQHQRERGHADPFGDFWLPQLRAGGVVLQVLPVFTEDQFVGEGALRRALRVIETAYWIAEMHAHDVAIVTNSGELEAALASDRIALVLAFEGMEPVGADVDIIDSFFRLGVRMASLTWNRRTMLADGTGERETGSGLTTIGIEAVARMEALGMIVDVSHISDTGFDHVTRIATRPFVASHSSCRDVYDHARNLTDDRLRAVAASGGFVGMNATYYFCGDEGTIDEYVSHAAHAVSVIGAAHVGLGLDFVADLFEQMDVILKGVLVDTADFRHIRGLQRPADLPALAVALTGRLGPDDAARVASGTLIESFGRLLPAA
jgi:membrane dipeptidase